MLPTTDRPRLSDDPGVRPWQTMMRMVVGSSATIAGAVYGTIVVLAAVTAGAKAFQNDLWRLVAIVVTTVLVLWLAHVYAHGLAESIQMGRRLDAAELGAIARRELAIPLAAVAPAGVLVLGAVDLIEGRTRRVARDSGRCRDTRGAGTAVRPGRGPRLRRARSSPSRPTLPSVSSSSR